MTERALAVALTPWWVATNVTARTWAWVLYRAH